MLIARMSGGNIRKYLLSAAPLIYRKAINPRHPARDEYTFAQWNHVPTLEPSPAVYCQTAKGSTTGSTMKKNTADHLLRRDNSFKKIKPPRTANHIKAECKGIGSNKNMLCTSVV